MRKGQREKVSQSGADVLASLDDNSLAAEVVADRHEALTVLFKRHSAAVFRAARRILGDSGEAEEVVQQTFLETYQHIKEFDPAKGSFLAWLLRRAKFRANDLRDHLNVERFYDWTAIDEAANAPHSAVHGRRNVHRQEIEPILDEFLRMLPFRHRKVLNLTFFEGRTAEEIAMQMNDSINVVRRLLYEALRRLRYAAKTEPGSNK